MYYMAMSKLHPGAKWQFRISGYFMFAFAGIFLGLWVVVPLAKLLFSAIEVSTSSILTTVIISIFCYAILVIIASEIYARMSYNR